MKVTSVIKVCSRPVAILYDWDGTIVRFRKEKFLASINRTLEVLGSSPIPSLQKTIRSTFFERCNGRQEEAMVLFRKYFSEASIEEEDLLPHAQEIIKQFHYEGFKQAIVSNLDHQLLEVEVDKVGFSKYFKVIRGSKNDKELKPQPTMLIETLEGMQMDTGLYVGDTETDMKAAKAARLKGVLIGRGELQDNNQCCIPNLKELSKIITIKQRSI